MLLRPRDILSKTANEERRELGRLPERIELQVLRDRGNDQSFGGQASKGIRWMPWHQEAMKDVAKLR